jgi:hypothetical protein
MVFWFLVLLTVFAGLLAWPGWVPVRAQDWPWIVALGGFGAAGQYGITRAFRLAPASVIAPFEYTAMLWAVGLDRIFWSVLPGGRVYAGGTAGRHAMGLRRRGYQPMRRISAGVRRMPAAATLSSRCPGEAVPGIGSMTGERDSNQASWA